VERLKVFLDGVRAMEAAREVVNPQRLRPLLDAPEPRAGSFLILALKQRKLDAVRVLTGVDFFSGGGGGGGLFEESQALACMQRNPLPPPPTNATQMRPFASPYSRPR
jgi:hypothetical protein